jgi:hypothetical protein
LVRSVYNPRAIKRAIVGGPKRIGGLARTRLIGHRKTNQQAHLAASAFNLIRMRSLTA